MTTRVGAHVLASGGVHQSGYPVTRQIERLEPFDTQNSGPADNTLRSKSADPALQSENQLAGLVIEIEGGADVCDVAPDAGEVPGRQRHDSGSSLDCFGEPVDV